MWPLVKTARTQIKAQVTTEVQKDCVNINVFISVSYLWSATLCLACAFNLLCQVVASVLAVGVVLSYSC